MACNRSGSDAPGIEVIQEEKFMDVLVQVRLLEAAYSVKFEKVDSTAGIAAYYKNLFQQQGMTKAQFEASYKYYAAKKDKMVEIEEKVLERLSIMNTEARKRAESEPQISADTIPVVPAKDPLVRQFENLKK